MEKDLEKKESKKQPILKLGGNFTSKDIQYEEKLDRKYFRQDVETLSKSLLGKMFVRETPKGVIKAIIVETEAYKAPLDKACHAYNSTFLDIQTRRQRRPSTSGLMGEAFISTLSTCLRIFA